MGRLHFQDLSDCWQNSVPCHCRAEVLSLGLLSAEGHSGAPRGHCHSFCVDFSISKPAKVQWTLLVLRPLQLPPVSKGSRDYTGPTRVIQDNLSLLRSTHFICKVSFATQGNICGWNSIFAVSGIRAWNLPWDHNSAHSESVLERLCPWIIAQGIFCLYTISPSCYNYVLVSPPFSTI